MKNIAIIGAGELGSRHLQSFATFREPLRIQVVDPNAGALVKARERFDDVQNGTSTHLSATFLEELDDLEREIDLAIIATTANVRLTVLQKLVALKQVRFLILEKVAFQSQAECESALNLIKGAGIEAWVNCPRRLYPVYNELKKRFENEKISSIKVTGINWGMACNSVHFLDLFAYLSSSTDYKIDTGMLENRIKESKRSGFLEVLGCITGAFENGVEFELECIESDAPPRVQIHINSINFNITVNEALGELTITDLRNRETKTNKFSLPYQSSLSASVASDILSSGRCALPSIEDAVSIHIPYLNALQHHIGMVLGKDIKCCPIT
ncbi:oxidoreductase-like [Oleiphilus messinensis]|uniref:Oxidoreductase-like n=1 Tax=Oleiphilus messinensis TaxID=141451 RepID=A0A1Y0IGC3_9GAMM|nr:Gfo/Idh/MocA family oxidoreductase [Oleiphilus messinensis]ARU59551.1 oxidoreductase-like [Oleiphilus messinensis]